MTTLGISSDVRTQVDLACSIAGRFTLWRRGGEVGLTLDQHHAGAVRRSLALLGVTTTISDLGVPQPMRSLAAIGTGLAPVRMAGHDEIDVLEVRVVPLGEATAGLTHRSAHLWRLSRRRRSRCRGLLRGTDALLEVRRSAWCERSTLAAARRSLRPVLFDRSATPRALRVFAADGALTRWVNG